MITPCNSTGIKTLNYNVKIPDSIAEDEKFWSEMYLKLIYPAQFSLSRLR